MVYVRALICLLCLFVFAPTTRAQNSTGSTGGTYSAARKFTPLKTLAARIKARRSKDCSNSCSAATAVKRCNCCSKCTHGPDCSCDCPTCSCRQSAGTAVKDARKPDKPEVK